MVTTRRYQVPDGVDANDLENAILQHVTSSRRGEISWEDEGGPGVLSVIGGTSTSGFQQYRRPLALIVTQSDRGHAAVAELLELMGNESAAQQSRPAPDAMDASRRLNPIDVPETPTVNGVLPPATTTPTLPTEPMIEESATLPGEPTMFVYDVAELSRLLSGVEDDGETPQQMLRWSEISSFARRPADGAISVYFTVQNGAQIAVQTDAETHAKISRAIKALTEAVKVSGGPSADGVTVIQGGSGNVLTYPRGRKLEGGGGGGGDYGGGR